MNCPTCGGNMTETKRDYKYTESGLDNITLENLTMLVCGCGEEMPVISNILDVHRDIALEIIKKNAPLTGPEIRFLRKEMRINGTVFGEMLGVRNVTVSRWETGEVSIGSVSDKLIRYLFVNKMGSKENKLIQIDIPEGNLQASQEIQVMIAVDDLMTTQDIETTAFAYSAGCEGFYRYRFQPADATLDELPYAA